MLLILRHNTVGQRTHLVLVNPDGEASGFHSISNLEHRRLWAVIVADENVSYATHKQHTAAIIIVNISFTSELSHAACSTDLVPFIARQGCK